MSSFFVLEEKGGNVTTIAQNWDYIHYHADNADLSSLYGMVNQTKDEIFNNHIKKAYNSRKSNLTKGMSKEAVTEIEAFLSGKAFAGYDSNTQNAYTNRISYYDYSPDDFRTGPITLPELATGADLAQNFITKAQSIVNQKWGQSTVNGYADYILSQYAKSKGYVPGGGSVATQIISSLLSRNNEEFFTVMGDQLKTNAQVLKMISAAYALPEANLGGTMTVKHSDSGSEKNVSGSKIAEEVARKFNKWGQYLNSTAAEAASVMATAKLAKDFFEEVKNVETSIKRVGSKNVQVTYEFDPYVTQIYQNAGITMERLKTKVSKPDAMYEVTNNGVTAYMGMTVKDYKNSIRPDSKKYDIQLQGGSPLLGLLVRELGLDGKELIQVQNLAAVHGDSSDLRKQWESLIKNLKWRALLDTLAGLNIPGDQNYFININGNLWTIDDFINHVMRNATVSWTEMANVGGQLSGGLTRSPYVEANKWVSSASGSDIPNPAYAKARSHKVQPQITAIMQNTKISVSMRLSKLALLFKSRING